MPSDVNAGRAIVGETRSIEQYDLVIRQTVKPDMLLSQQLPHQRSHLSTLHTQIFELADYKTDFPSPSFGLSFPALLLQPDFKPATII